MNNKLSVDICICTFRRDYIIETLRSLAKLEIDSTWHVRIIVADNDDTPSAQEKVNQASKNLPFEVIYIHAPARNISIARNTCLETATADYVAFLDDDEIASPRWLKELVDTMQQEKSEAVLGPVDAVYQEDAPTWMREGHFHSTRPVWVNRSIITGYTCNLLLDCRSPLLANLRFDPELGKTGGEDTVFLSMLYTKGGKISYAEKALLTEPVHHSRASLLWLIKRRFRSGQTHAFLLIKNNGDTLENKTIQMAKALMKACCCFLIAVPYAFMPTKMINFILRGSLHLGVIARLIGKKELIQYG